MSTDHYAAFDSPLPGGHQNETTTYLDIITPALNDTGFTSQVHIIFLLTFQDLFQGTRDSPEDLVNQYGVDMRVWSNNDLKVSVLTFRGSISAADYLQVLPSLSYNRARMVYGSLILRFGKSRTFLPIGGRIMEEVRRNCRHVMPL